MGHWILPLNPSVFDLLNCLSHFLLCKPITVKQRSSAAGFFFLLRKRGYIFMTEPSYLYKTASVADKPQGRKDHIMPYIFQEKHSHAYHKVAVMNEH